MIRVVSWNIFKRWQPWHELVEMARQGEADVALLQEAGNPPPDLTHPVRYGEEEFWRRHLYEGRSIYDRWCLVVKLSDRVDVEWFRAVPPISVLGERDIGVSGIGTIAAAKVMPRGRPKDEAFIAVSMYARWMKPTRPLALHGGSALPTFQPAGSSRTSQSSSVTRIRPGHRLLRGSPGAPVSVRPRREYPWAGRRRSGSDLGDRRRRRSWRPSRP